MIIEYEDKLGQYQKSQLDSICDSDWKSKHCMEVSARKRVENELYEKTKF